MFNRNIEWNFCIFSKVRRAIIKFLRNGTPSASRCRLILSSWNLIFFRNKYVRRSKNIWPFGLQSGVLPHFHIKKCLRIGHSGHLLKTMRTPILLPLRNVQLLGPDRAYCLRNNNEQKFRRFFIQMDLTRAGVTRGAYHFWSVNVFIVKSYKISKMTHTVDLVNSYLHI